MLSKFWPLVPCFVDLRGQRRRLVHRVESPADPFRCFPGAAEWTPLVLLALRMLLEGIKSLFRISLCRIFFRIFFVIFIFGLFSRTFPYAEDSDRPLLRRGRGPGLVLQLVDETGL